MGEGHNEGVKSAFSMTPSRLAFKDSLSSIPPPYTELIDVYEIRGNGHGKFLATSSAAIPQG